jgi:mRNA deadenylase 3'-5' endonuclease subunit Ccr4
MKGGQLTSKIINRCTAVVMNSSDFSDMTKSRACCLFYKRFFIYSSALKMEAKFTSDKVHFQYNVLRFRTQKSSVGKPAIL